MTKLNKVYVYLIHEGTIHEGGGTTEVYGTEEKAIKFALMKVEEKRKEDIKRGRISWSFYHPWTETKIEEEYKNDFFIKGWSNEIYVINIYKYEVL